MLEKRLHQVPSAIDGRQETFVCVARSLGSVDFYHICTFDITSARHFMCVCRFLGTISFNLHVGRCLLHRAHHKPEWYKLNFVWESIDVDCKCLQCKPSPELATMDLQNV